MRCIQGARQLVHLLCVFLQAPFNNFPPGTYFLDVSEPASHARVFMPEMCPVFLAAHKVGVFHLHLNEDGTRIASYDRHLLGVEHLLIMGFPRDVNVEGLTDANARSIAGHTISVHMMCAINLWMLTSIDFDTKYNDAVVKHAMPVVGGCLGWKPRLLYAAEMDPLTSMLGRRKYLLPGMERSAKATTYTLYQIKMLSNQKTIRSN